MSARWMMTSSSSRRCCWHTSQPCRRVYFGRFYYSNWQSETYRFVGSAYTSQAASRNGISCRKSSRPCQGPFPFTTGSLILLSRDLARELATAPAAAADIERSRARMVSPNGSKTAFEDVWVGYALSYLLPRSQGKMISQLHASISPLFYSDKHEVAKRFDLRNVTMLVHPSKKVAPGGYSFESRMLAAYQHALQPRCDVSGLVCIPGSADKSPRYRKCSVRLPGNSSCREGQLREWNLRWQVKQASHQVKASAMRLPEAPTPVC